MNKATKVEFYVLETEGLAAQLHFACRLTEKAYGLSTEIYAHTPSDEVAQQLDKMLWTFRQGSFIPHELLSKEQPRAPVRIGTAEHPQTRGDLLINLCDAAPDFAGEFERVAEIIPAGTQARQAGRERFRHYREHGIKPHTHEIR